MKARGFIVIATLAATVLLVAACGSSSKKSSSSAAPAPTTKGTVTVDSSSSSSLGTILVDGSGRTLYMFAKDTGPSSSCSGACASNWPPLTTTVAPKAGSGVAGSSIKTVRRSDGKMQVTFDGHPLYLFTGDKAAGDVNGQGVDAFGAKWYALTPAGKQASGSTKSSSGGSGGGYGY
jgi:predicted lipoprotein with Yx(FWY)xxD motif